MTDLQLFYMFYKNFNNYKQIKNVEECKKKNPILLNRYLCLSLKEVE